MIPGEVAVKEVKEESGFDVKAVKLIAVLDKKCHPHLPSPYQVYKMFIQCEIIGGQPKEEIKTTGVDFFAESELPSNKINMMFQGAREMTKDHLITYIRVSIEDIDFSDTPKINAVKRDFQIIRKSLNPICIIPLAMLSQYLMLLLMQDLMCLFHHLPKSQRPVLFDSS